jgi:hypothetical protein
VLSARWSFEAGGDTGAGTRVSAVGEDGDTLAFTDPDDLAGAGRGEVVSAAGQGRRDPKQLAGRIGEDLDIHAVPSVLGRVVRTAVTDPVALGEGPVEEDEVRAFSRSVFSRPGARAASRPVTAVT